MKILLSILVLLTILPGKIYAHQLLENSNNSVLMHIEPDDKAKAQEKTLFHFRIDDTLQSFSLKDCNCKVIVTGGDSTHTYALKNVDPKEKIYYNIVSEVFFEKPGVYAVNLEASPIATNSFQPINSSFTVRVEESEKEILEKQKTKLTTSYFAYALFFASFAIMVLILIVKLIQSIRKK